ncbi:MAG TPA: metallophosphoesterase, partial [Thermoanaerobaculia bacterium]|nr:metallophosphoesterase [Thermoanaerobaculia bacterium]
LSWPAELRAARREEVDGAAERAVAAALAAEADALLVPGDLWDAESVPPASIHRMLEALASFAPRPVFVAPGNHDFVGAGGWYDASVLAALGMRTWPENVHVFRTEEWTATPFPGRPDVTVVGRAFLSPLMKAARPLASPPPRPATPYALLLFHGSYETYGGPDAPHGAKLTAPFSREELLAAGFTWTALGHHHHVETVDDDDGISRAAYSGCPTGRGFDETGPRFFLKVTLDGPSKTEVELLPADARTIRDLTLDVGEEPRDLLERAAALLGTERVSSDDIVRLTLTGVQVYGARPSAVLAPLTSRVAHLVLRDRTTRPSHGELPGLETAEGRFVNDLLARREQPDANLALLDLALRLGRDALTGRALAPPELEEM